MATPPPPPRAGDRRALGIALRIGTALTFSVMFALMKLVEEQGASVIEVVFYRNLFGLPFVLAYVIAGPGLAAIRPRKPSAHAIRAAIGLGSLLTNVYALTLLPLADATAIGFTAPLIATFLAAIVLRDQVGWHRWLALALGLIGVIIIVQPGGGGVPPVGAAVALLGAFGVAMVTITVRQIAASETAISIVFWFAFLSAAILLVPVLFDGTAHGQDVWLTLLAIAVTGTAGQMMMTASLSFAPVPLLAPFDYLQIVGTTLIGWIIWSTVPGANTLMGAALIAIGGIYTIWREHRRHRERTGASPPPA